MECSARAGNPSTSTSTSVLECNYCDFCTAEANKFQEHESMCIDRYEKNCELSDPSKVYACQICNKFKNSDGNLLEEHVVKCVEKARSTG